MPKPFKKHIIFKLKLPNGIICRYIPVNWMDFEPNKWL